MLLLLLSSFGLVVEPPLLACLMYLGGLVHDLLDAVLLGLEVVLALGGHLLLPQHLVVLETLT